MPDCLFCKIVQGHIPAHKVHEDDRTLAFLDIHPLRTGHTLVIPKRHGAKLQHLEPDDAAAVLRTAHLLLPRLARAVDAPDATLALHDGPAAGQEVPHLHLHIVPRKEGDGGGPIHAAFGTGRPKSDAEQLRNLAKRVQG